MRFNINLALHQFTEYSETTGCAEITKIVSSSKKLKKMNNEVEQECLLISSCAWDSQNNRVS